MSTIISAGTRFQLFDESVTSHETLPAGTYHVEFNPLSGYSLLKQNDLRVGVKKMYGNHEQKVDRIIRRYKKHDSSLGAMFTGNKGMGKSLSCLQ